MAGHDSSRLAHKHLARLQRRKRSAGRRAAAQRVAERLQPASSIASSVSWKHAVMVRERERRTAIGERFHCVFRIHVLVAHEPARLIGADGEDRRAQQP